jgi:hypothetical protein
MCCSRGCIVTSTRNPDVIAKVGLFNSQHVIIAGKRKSGESGGVKVAMMKRKAAT